MPFRANHVRVDRYPDGRVRLSFIASDGRVFNTFHIPAEEVENVAALLLPAGTTVTYPEPANAGTNEGA